MVPEIPLETTDPAGVRQHIQQHLVHWCDLLDSHFTDDCVARRYTLVRLATTDMFYRRVLPYIRVAVARLGEQAHECLFRRGGDVKPTMVLEDMAVFRGRPHNTDISHLAKLVDDSYCGISTGETPQELDRRWLTLVQRAEQIHMHTTCTLEEAVHALCEGPTIVLALE